ncbi:nucleotide sugar dehydrogenase [Actinoallomurus iriomotensis]|uniref:UDP-N-acetyl-D-glucosamine dehydrogenase n=1 Tax=Actinoallomurus iriomotensis TaxID=478107 RepID=A0A9W6RV35_9ACTN|nr:nucleotide sugar dehydrogenase [Actinoallomurus iriomotensis]GLY80697.1 UDP-N-acetyl-D-glucosamine dehydrogenase [Actinoallomurus iriomotensis]
MDRSQGDRLVEWDLVVVGLGYVGMPLAREAVRGGMRVAGLDVDPARIARLNSGISHVDDISDGEVTTLLGEGFLATSDDSVLAAADTVVICVPTPLDEDRRPDLGAVIGAGRMVADRLGPGTLVVLESTTWPGTTEEVLRPLLEKSGLSAGIDFHLAYSPERIDPGNPVYDLRNTPKIVGGVTGSCLDRAMAFYGKLVEQVVPVRGTREAEMAKLLENTYRQVNIALVNEIAVLCDELSIDVWDTITAAATKPFGYQPFRPGPGVGGHCIPIDPSYLSHRVRRLGHRFQFAELAQQVNDRMPAYVAERATRLLHRHGRCANGAEVVLLGVTYKADIADGRESPAEPLARRLHAARARVSYHDPLMDDWPAGGVPVRRVPDLEEALDAADLAILLQPHRSFDLSLVATRAPLVLDTRGVLPPSDTVERL